MTQDARDSRTLHRPRDRSEIFLLTASGLLTCTERLSCNRGPQPSWPPGSRRGGQGPATAAPGLKPRRASHRHGSSRIVRIHGREGKEVARRSGGDDVRHIAGGQGRRPAGPDEIINLVWVQDTEHRALQMVERSMSLRSQAISVPLVAARTALAAAECTTRPAVPEAVLEEAAAAASPAERTGTDMAQASANRARITDPRSAAAAASRSAAEPASEVAQVRMMAPDLAARIAANRLDQGRHGGLTGRLSFACRRHGRGMAGSKMLLLSQPGTYAGDSTQPRDSGTRAATRTETVVTMMKQSPPGAKAAVVSTGSQAAGAVPEATAAVPEAATFTPAMSTTIAQPATIAGLMEQAYRLVPKVFETSVKLARVAGHIPHCLASVVFGVVAIGNRGRIVFATGRVIVSGNFTGNCVLETPPIRPDRGSQSQSNHGGQ